MKIGELLNWGVVQLEGGILRLDAEVLFSYASGKDRVWLVAHGKDSVDPSIEMQFRNYIEHRKAGEPVAYIVGTKEFFGLDFKVNSHVLVPRPETEMLVEMGLEAFDKNPESIVIDVGTGSGAIAVAVAKNNFTVRVIATDISSDALEIAKQNAYKHEVTHRVAFLKGNLLEPVDFNSGNYIILANLPYLSEEEYAVEPSIQKEPKRALVADENGNALYRELFEQLKKLPEGVAWTLFAEFDPRHGAWMREVSKEYFPNREISVQKDFAGHERVLSIRLV